MDICQELENVSEAICGETRSIRGALACTGGHRVGRELCGRQYDSLVWWRGANRRGMARQLATNEVESRDGGIRVEGAARRLHTEQRRALRRPTRDLLNLIQATSVCQRPWALSLTLTLSVRR